MTAATILEGADAVRGAVGTHLGYSDWITVTQEQINLFAESTGDHQWIHVDVAKATAGPFGAPIAHGYLTLALSNLFLPQIVEVRGSSLGVNYGVDKVRFPAPVPVGSRLRGGASMVEATEVNDWLQTLIRITIEREGDTKPVCIIDSISRWRF